MTDVFDEAIRVEELARDFALAEQKRRAGLTGKTLADSASECARCEEPIPLKRRQAIPGCQYCVSCQTRKELNEGKR